MRRAPALLLLLAACDAAPPPPPGADTAYSMAAPTTPIAPPTPASRERCYGISAAYANDGLAPPPRDDGRIIADAGTATRDGQGDAWVYVRTGTCAARGGSLLPRRP